MNTDCTTIDSVPVPDFLRWLIEQKIDLPTAATLTGVGIVDLDQLSAAAELGWDFQSEAKKLLSTGASVEPDIIISSLLTVGHNVLAEGIDNIDQWALIAERVKASGWNQVRAHQVCNMFMQAGRSPSFAADLMTAAEQTGTSVMAYGAGPEITTTVFRDLSNAGIRDLDGLSAFLAAGLTITEAISVARMGVEFGAVLAAVADGLPRERWAAVLPGLPRGWFPGPPSEYTHSHRQESPDARGLLTTPGATWEILHELASSGWADCPSRVFNKGGAWKKDGLPFIAFDDALLAARHGVSFTQMDRWSLALTTGKHGSKWNDQTMPPLTSRYPTESTVSAVLRLSAAGMKSSWVSEFRASGARSVDDLERMVTGGLTRNLSAELRARAGIPISGWVGAPKRFPDVQAFFTAMAA